MDQGVLAGQAGVALAEGVLRDKSFKTNIYNCVFSEKRFVLPHVAVFSTVNDECALCYVAPVVSTSFIVDLSKKK